MSIKSEMLERRSAARIRRAIAGAKEAQAALDKATSRLRDALQADLDRDECLSEIDTPNGTYELPITEDGIDTFIRDILAD